MTDKFDPTTPIEWQTISLEVRKDPDYPATPSGQIIFEGETYILRADVMNLVNSAQAVIERWETPIWKDVPATASFIASLRQALAAFNEKHGG